MQLVVTKSLLGVLIGKEYFHAFPCQIGSGLQAVSTEPESLVQGISIEDSGASPEKPQKNRGAFIVRGSDSDTANYGLLLRRRYQVRR